MVEDDRTSRVALARHLEREGYWVASADSGETAWAQLETECHRLVLLDWHLPGIQGADICRMIREAEDDAYTYIIVLTGSENRASFLEAFEAGADDFLNKPFDPIELKARLQVASRLLRFHARMSESERKLRDLADRDGLTHLLNRRALQHHLQHRLGGSVLGGPDQVGFLMVDIDRFKRINDSYGHLAGDEVLRQVGCRIGDTVRATDSVGRYGGEEFGVVIPGASTAAVWSVAKRVWKAVRGLAVEFEGHRIDVTVSVGAALGETSRCSWQQLVGSADEAMYRAKRGGRDRVVFKESSEVFRVVVDSGAGDSGFSSPPAALHR